MTLKLHDPDNILAAYGDMIGGLAPTHRISVSKTLLKETASRQSQSVSEVLYGETVTFIEQQGDWMKVVCLRDGYQGWIPADSVVTCRIKAEATHYISAPVTHIYSDASLKSEPLQACYMTSPIMITGDIKNGFYPVEGEGWVYAKHILAEAALSLDPVSTAKKFMGSAYLWGGRTYEGLDCSGLIQVSLFMSGLSVHRDSGPQFASLGRLLGEDEAPKRGDLAFFPGHVGWMVDAENLLHANATHMAVTIDPLKEVISWVAAETDKPPFLGYRRLGG
jgi:cell wall-associated NlpC family hydrolase